MKLRSLLLILLVCILGVGAHATIMTHQYGSKTNKWPMDILALANKPAVVAYSLNRALSHSYTGKLFQAVRASDSTTLDIGMINGIVDHAAYDTFCTSTTCFMSKLYDQGPSHLDFIANTGFGATGSSALVRRIVLTNGKIVFNAEKELNGTLDGPQRPAVGYSTGTRNGDPNNGGMPGTPVTGASVPVTEYWTINGTFSVNNCCFDFGEGESTYSDNGNGHMFALGLGGNPNPLQSIDIENGGLFLSGTGYAGATIENGIAKTDGATVWTGKTGHAQTGALITWNNNVALPGDHTPLLLEGGIAMMQGGDGSNASPGAFYEGYIVASQTADAIDNAIQASSVSFYGPP